MGMWKGLALELKLDVDALALPPHHILAKSWMQAGSHPHPPRRTWHLSLYNRSNHDAANHNSND